MNTVVATELGTFAVDLESGEVEPVGYLDSARYLDIGGRVPSDTLDLGLPRLVAAAQSGATIVAVVDAKPPLLVSRDAGATWSESGRGLPIGRSVALAADDPDLVVYASRNRLHVSRDGGRFWETLAAELPAISAVELREA